LKCKNIKVYKKIKFNSLFAEKKLTKILAIESSCDDMSAAVLVEGNIISNVVSSQIVHEQYGGVVPEVASRQHLIDIIPVVDSALQKSNTSLDELNAIAVTQGPGLLGSLLVGVNFAKSLSLSLNIPLISVHHMHAHILSHFAEDPRPDFPFLCLTVSGGHTQIVKVKAYNEMEVLGRTLDDAAGEAFDKCGKILGLAYPAGPLIDKLSKNGAPVFEFGEPAIQGYDYSFSGFKTSVLYFIKEQLKNNENFIEENLQDLCASIQDTIINILIRKLKKAVESTGIKTVAIAGGVAANSGLRKKLKEFEIKHSWNIFVPSLQFCTDNAGMVAVAAYFKYRDNNFSDLHLTPDARLPF
jgi:N6-L-threonylcarbamoyladenine synthase